MGITEFPASRATRHLVRAYRVIHFDLTGLQAASVKFVPASPEACLAFVLRDKLEPAEYPDGRHGLQEACGIMGVHDVATRCPVPKNMLLLQIPFQPGVMQRLAGISAEALHNQYLDAVDIFGPEARRVHSRLQNARTYVEMIAIADFFIAGLAGRRRPGRNFDVPLRLLRENPGISIDWLADQTSLSLRQFERCCLEHTGMTPKSFARLSRFSCAFNLRLSRPERDWLSIAVDCGYYDYQHMARDSRHFMSQTPAQAYEMQGTSPERLLGVAHDFNVSYPDPLEAAPTSR